MKNRNWMMMLIVVVLCFAVPAWAQQLPESGKMAVGDINEVVVEQVSSTQLVVKVPVSSDQIRKQNIVNPTWNVMASVAYTNGQDWVLTGMSDYSVKTEVEGSYLKATIPLPASGNGYFWLRIWGQDSKSKNWLWINQGSTYCRKDSAGNPGYEIVANAKTGKAQVVPAQYDFRK